MIRDDVDDAKYRIRDLPVLAELAGEGHGVPIAPQWVVTAAHALAPAGLRELSIGEPRRVECVFAHPGYRRLPQAPAVDATASGDFSRIYDFLASSDDIALVRLAAPVAG